jgi:outer membrane protein assembly factor BamB
MRPSALLVDSLVYICNEAGVLRCLEAKTGKEHYRRAVLRRKHIASPVYGDGKIYFTSRDGTVTVVQSGTEFKILATNRMDETICASPVISGNRIYLRSFDALFAVEGP